MSFFTAKALRTILLDAPVIVDSVHRLIGGLRKLTGRDAAPPVAPTTFGDVQHELRRMDEQIKANSESDVEQLKLMEELARQNELLAASVSRLSGRVAALAVICVVALLLAVLAFLRSGG